MKDLVVLIPGILGSVLKRDGRVVWGYSARSLGRFLMTRGAVLRDGLRLDGDDPERDQLDDGVTADGLMPDLHLIPRYWKIDGYTAAREALLAGFELTAGRNYFEFAYDWRRDNRANARRLARAWRARR